MAKFEKMTPQFDLASVLTCDDIDNPVAMLNAERECALREVELSCSPQLERTDSSTLIGRKRKMSMEESIDRVDGKSGDNFTTPTAPKRDILAPGAPKKKR
jgi:hypothetical protein